MHKVLGVCLQKIVQTSCAIKKGFLVNTENESWQKLEQISYENHVTLLQILTEISPKAMS